MNEDCEPYNYYQEYEEVDNYEPYNYYQEYEEVDNSISRIPPHELREYKDD